MTALLKAIDLNLVESLHDCAEGGLAVAIAEMLISGGFGAKISISNLPGNAKRADYKLFSESNGRWIVEVSQKNRDDFLNLFKNIQITQIGLTVSERKLMIDNYIDIGLDEIYKNWKEPIYKSMGEGI
jgi:phosphoribosylformylglycinamidine synthase